MIINQTLVVLVSKNKKNLFSGIRLNLNGFLLRILTLMNRQNWYTRNGKRNKITYMTRKKLHSTLSISRRSKDELAGIDRYDGVV